MGGDDVDSAVYFQGDGERLSPAATIRRLAVFEARHGIRPNCYSLGGIVEELEEALARTLGKEAALFLPTGTLANLLAITRHSGRRGQALVPAESHVYRDTGDGVARLGGIQMIPLAPDRPGPTVEEVRGALDRTQGDRVYSPPGVVLLESPVRRQIGARPVLRRAAGDQRAVPGAGGAHPPGRGPAVHDAAATGVPVRRYCALFDTVYVSLCKYLGAPFGAVLAGSREFVDGLYHERRRFGGSLPGAWMGAALVLQGLEGFEAASGPRWRRGGSSAGPRRYRGLRVSPLADGSNIFPLRLDGRPGAGLNQGRCACRLQRQGIILPPGSGTERGDPVRRCSPWRSTPPSCAENEALLRSFGEAVAGRA